MKKLAAAAAMAALIVVPAKADVIDYAQLLAGVTQSPDLGYGCCDYEMDLGYNVGGGFGWKVAPNVAVGADLFFTSSDYDGYTTSLESFSALLAGTYFFDMDGCRPFVGAGVGANHIAYVGAGSSSGAEWAFGYQGSAGVLIPADDKLDIIIGYRYQGASDVTIDGVPNIEYQSHNLSVGFNFNL